MYIVQQFEKEKEEMMETIIYKYTGYFIIGVTCVIITIIYSHLNI